jgi:hypothetical protein
MARPACLRVGLPSRSNFCQKFSNPDGPAHHPSDRLGGAGHQLQQHVLEVRRPPADDLPGGHAHQALVGVEQESAQQGHRRPALAPGGGAEQPEPCREGVGGVGPQAVHPLVLHGVVAARDGEPVADPGGVLGGAPLHVALQVGVAPPQAAGDALHAQAQVVVLEPVGLAQQRVQDGRLVDVGEGGAEVAAQLAVACPQQERFDVLAGRRLLEPADQRALPAVLGGVQDRQRLAAGPVA